MSEQQARQGLSPEEQAGFQKMWKYGRRDLISAPVLAVVFVVGVILIGDTFPRRLMDVGVPEALARMYFVVPFAFVIWQAVTGVRMMARARRAMHPQSPINAK